MAINDRNVPPAAAATLARAADWFYETCEMYEDEDLDPGDHLAVLRRAFTTSDCDDFAWLLNRITGWQVVKAVWTMPDGWEGHHALVRAPDGRLLDGTGWTDEAALRRRYLGRAKRAMVLEDVEPHVPLSVLDFIEVPCPEREAEEPLDGDDWEASLRHMLAVIRVLPFAPFNTRGFRAMSGQDVAAARPSDHPDTTRHLRSRTGARCTAWAPTGLGADHDGAPEAVLGQFRRAMLCMAPQGSTEAPRTRNLHARQCRNIADEGRRSRTSPAVCLMADFKASRRGLAAGID